MFFNMLLGHTAETHTDVCTHSRTTDMTCFRLHMLDSSAPSSYSSFDGRKNKHLVSHVWLDLWPQKMPLPSSQEQGLESVLPVRELLNQADHEGVACCTSMPLDQASMCPSPRNTHHGDHQALAPLWLVWLSAGQCHTLTAHPDPPHSAPTLSHSPECPVPRDIARKSSVGSWGRQCSSGIGMTAQTLGFS